MIQPTQILLYSVIVILTIMMVLIGWQIYQILSQMRKMMEKFNLMMDGAVNMTTSIGKSLQSMSGFTEGLKAVFGLFKIFRKKDDTDGEQE